MATKSVNVLWAVLGLVGGMALGAWYAGSKIQSPGGDGVAHGAARAVPNPGSGRVARTEL